MNDVILKVGTYDEIIEKYKKPLGVNEFPHQSVKYKLDEAIADKSQIASIYIPPDNPDEFTSFTNARQLVLISDYHSKRAEYDIQHIDDSTTHKDKMDRIKIIIGMELDAEERWNRILKIVEEFEGKVVSL